MRCEPVGDKVSAGSQGRCDPRFGLDIWHVDVDVEAVVALHAWRIPGNERAGTKVGAHPSPITRQSSTPLTS